MVGQTLLDVYGDSVGVRARAAAAAGSDARMNGCEMPVVINSGSHLISHEPRFDGRGYFCRAGGFRPVAHHAADIAQGVGDDHPHNIGVRPLEERDAAGGGRSGADRAAKGGQGLVKDRYEQTIDNFCRMAKNGMESTDEEILRIMVES